MSIVSKLAPKDKKALALLYETDSYTSLIKLFRLVKRNAGEQAVKAIDQDALKRIQGEFYAIERLEECLKEIYKLDQKN